MRKAIVIFVALALVLGISAMALAEKGEKVTVTGEVIDTFCYATAGAKGPGHTACAIACAKKGIPLGLLENGTNNIYILLPNKDKTPLPKAVIDKCGEQATIAGQKYVSGGVAFITVESVK